MAGPSVKTLMTPFPYSVDVTATLAVALTMMNEHGMRHLPVTAEGSVVGVLSKRELAVATAVCGQDLTVGEICTREPYMVEHSTTAHEVAATMAERQIGSAIVLHHGKLAGIVTTTDICREYAALHRAEPPDQTA
ncbi:MAG: CBS domain-containing protein [Myxococcota bacterium]